MFDIMENREKIHFGGGRIEWIDRMRGLAILSVVIQHVSYYYSNASDFSYLNLIALCNMGVFFFVSGFIMEKTCKVDGIRTALLYIRKKFLQLMVPFLFWGFMSKYIFSRELLPITMVDVLHQWKEPSLWYLLTLFGYVIPFAISRAVIKKHNAVFLKGAFWLLYVATLLFVWKTTGELRFAIVYIPYFVLGIAVSEYNALKTLFENRWLGTLSICLVLLLTNYYSSGAQSLLNTLIKLVVTFSVVVLLYQLCNGKWNTRVDKFISKCGVYSIGIYALHWPFINIDSITTSFSTSNELLAALVALLISLVISSFCIFIKKKLSLYPVIDGVMFGGKWK